MKTDILKRLDGNDFLERRQEERDLSDEEEDDKLPEKTVFPWAGRHVIKEQAFQRQSPASNSLKFNQNNIPTPLRVRRPNNVNVRKNTEVTFGVNTIRENNQMQRNAILWEANRQRTNMQSATRKKETIFPWRVRQASKDVTKQRSNTQPSSVPRELTRQNSHSKKVAIPWAVNNINGKNSRRTMTRSSSATRKLRPTATFPWAVKKATEQTVLLSTSMGQQSQGIVNRRNDRLTKPLIPWSRRKLNVIESPITLSVPIANQAKQPRPQQRVFPWATNTNKENFISIRTVPSVEEVNRNNLRPRKTFFPFVASKGEKKLTLTRKNPKRLSHENVDKEKVDNRKTFSEIKRVRATKLIPRRSQAQLNRKKNHKSNQTPNSLVQKGNTNSFAKKSEPKPVIKKNNLRNTGKSDFFHKELGTPQKTGEENLKALEEKLSKIATALSKLTAKTRETKNHKTSNSKAKHRGTSLSKVKKINAVNSSFRNTKPIVTASETVDIISKLRRKGTSFIDKKMKPENLQSVEIRKIFPRHKASLHGTIKSKRKLNFKSVEKTGSRLQNADSEQPLEKNKEEIDADASSESTETDTSHEGKEEKSEILMKKRKQSDDSNESFIKESPVDIRSLFQRLKNLRSGDSFPIMKTPANTKSITKPPKTLKINPRRRKTLWQWEDSGPSVTKTKGTETTFLL